LNTTLTPHSIIHGDACFAYFNKIWGIPRLRFELQLAATGPKSAQRALAPQEIERLRGELDGLKNDVKELTETQHQATHTIAAMKTRAAAPTPLTGNSSTTSRSISQPGHHRRFRHC